MPTRSAVRNILASYRFQLSLKGGLRLRLAYATLYWTRYLHARYWFPRVDTSQAHALAWRYLGKAGWNQKTVTLKVPTGIVMEADLMTAFMILREIYDIGIYENCALGDFSPLEGNIVIDIGSQQGTYTLLASKKVGHRGKVFAMEPEPHNYSILEKNILLNQLDNVRIFQIAISDDDGKADFYINPDNTGGHSLVVHGENWSKTSVQKMTLDHLMREISVSPDLIKIDVEGSALAVLRGGIETLRQNKPKIVLELDSIDEEKTISELLEGLDYKTIRKGNNLFATVEKMGNV